jgi:hypothetical protein
MEQPESSRRKACPEPFVQSSDTCSTGRVSPWNQWPNAFSLLCIVLLATNYFVPFADLDYTWQIQTGERILQTGSLRPVDDFTYTIAGCQVPEFEWLYEVTLFTVWSSLGYGGLKLLKTVLVVTPLLLVASRLRKEGVQWHGIAVSLLTAVFLLSPAWNLRPLYCTTIGLLLISGMLHDHCLGRRPLPWWLVAIMLAWANLHPGVIAGQGLLAGAIGMEWLSRWLKAQQALDRAACWRLTAVGGIGLLATFISPNPVDRLLYPFRPEVGHRIQQVFVEMQPLYAFLARSPYVAWLAYLLAGLVAYTVVVRFRHYRLWEIALLCGLTGLANLAVRSLQDWVLVLLALGGPQLAHCLSFGREHLPARSGSGPGMRPVRARKCSRLNEVFRCGISALLQDICGFAQRMCQSPLFSFQWFWPGMALAVLVLLSLIPPLARQMPIQEDRQWPTEALDWIECQQLHGRFFAPPDYGSYVTWRLGRQARCYVDTRGFFFPALLLEDSHYLPQLGPQWRSRLDRVFAYQTDFFLLETTGPRGRLWNALSAHVPKPLYCDHHSALLSAAQVREALAALENPSRPRAGQAETGTPRAIEAAWAAR